MLLGRPGSVQLGRAGSVQLDGQGVSSAPWSLVVRDSVGKPGGWRQGLTGRPGPPRPRGAEQIGHTLEESLTGVFQTSAF